MVFTGLVQAVGDIQSNLSHDGFHQISISIPDQPLFWKAVQIGDSIAVNGVCLTVDSFDERRTLAHFRVSSETLSKTCIRQYSINSKVNVECALHFGQPLGGHVVSGHVHTTTRVLDVIFHNSDQHERDLWFKLPIEFHGGVKYKESICVNGVSLTVAELDSVGMRFRVSLIKKTVETTTMKQLGRGDLVNLEFNQHLNPCPPDDTFFMRLAIEESQKGRYTTAPNPWVGCVLVAEDGMTILGRGHHVFAGGEHAEAQAINYAHKNKYMLKNATLYVTLEPCHHFGRQPPCNQLIVKHGFKKVIFGLVDPDARTNGSSCEWLRNNHIEVVQGVCEEEIRADLQPYIHNKKTGMPFVIAKLALTVDGCFTLASNCDHNWITNEQARHHAHTHLRATSQAIIVGSQTVLKDNPHLTVRDVPTMEHPDRFRQPLRVVIDSTGTCCHNNLHILQDQQIAPTLMVTTRTGSSEQVRAEWSKQGVQVYVQDTPDGRVNLGELLQYLSCKYEVLQVLIEGGAELQAAFLCQGLVNEYWLYRSSNVMSSAGRSWASCLHQTLNTSSFKLLCTQTMEDKQSTLERFEVVSKHTPALPDDQHATSTIFDDFSAALECFRKGGMIIVMDDESRENEGDLIVRADMVQEHQIALMRRYTTGIICVTMNQDRADAFGLLPMVDVNSSSDPHQTAFTITCDSVRTSTGVSASDRCETIRVLAAHQPDALLLRKPGHMFPLVARQGGLLTRRGHTEAAVDLCKLAGAEPQVGVISELNNDDGTMMRYDDCLAFSKRFKLPIIHLNQIVEALKSSSSPSYSPCEMIGMRSPARCLAECKLYLDSVDNAGFRFATFYSKHNPLSPHRVLIKDAEANNTKPAMVRIHSECFTGDVLGSSHCDCGEQLQRTISQLAKHSGMGIIVFPSGHEGRGIGLTNKILAYKLIQESNGAIDTYEANLQLGFLEDSRTYDEAIEVIQAILPKDHDKRIILLTSNPLKKDAFVQHGFYFDSQPIVCQPSEHNRNYLLVKAKKHQENVEEVPTAMVRHNPSHPGTFYGTNLIEVDLSHKKLCVIQAGWHKPVSDVFLCLMRKQLQASGITAPWKHLVVPGSWEIPLALSQEMHKQEMDCYVVVGAVMKGETMHFEMMSTAITNKLMDLQVEHGRPVVNCILNVLNQQQMEDRFLGKTDMHTSIAATIKELLCGPTIVE